MTAILVVVLMVVMGFMCFYLGAKVEHDYWQIEVDRLNKKIRRLKAWLERMKKNKG